MDFQKATGHLADSKVYILLEGKYYEGSWILSVFATKVAAEMALAYYEANLGRNHRYYYEIREETILETAKRKSEGTETATVGQGPDPDHVPESGT